MSERSNRTYRDQEPVEAYVGDPFSGVPVDRNIVKQVATEYSLDTDLLARALRDVERARDLVNTGGLFSEFDPVPLGTDGNGHLYLTAEATTCWEVVAEHLGLTLPGRDAIATAHDRHVHEHGRTMSTDAGIGFIVTCPEFPASVINDVHTILNRTTLSARQATIWALDQHALGAPAIADILSVSETIVGSELVEVDRETDRITEAARTLDLPNHLTRMKPDPRSDRWLGIKWSQWFDLQNRESLLTRLPKKPGLYRVRHTRVQGLLYIGETGSSGGIWDRVGHGLAVDLDSSTQPQGGNHNATIPLWKVVSQIDGTLEVSFATPPVAANRRHRLALEAALVAMCRRETGRTPRVMLNRDPLLKTFSRSVGEGTGCSPSLQDESYRVPSWRNWRSVTDPEWLGLDWTAPRSLSERSSVEYSGACTFRVWEPQDETSEWKRVLTSVGTTESLYSRLFNLQREYGQGVTFSVAELSNLSRDDVARSRELKEVRYDLVGAHYLTTGQPPEDHY